VVDVLESPEEAERQRIMATPTLLREYPPPRRMVTGDFSNSELVLALIAPELKLPGVESPSVRNGSPKEPT
jgi:circadian clock protein KaiB